MYKYALAALLSAVFTLSAAPAAQAAAHKHSVSKKHAVSHTVTHAGVSKARAGRVIIRVRNGHRMVMVRPVRSAYVVPRSAGDVAGLNLTPDQVGLASNVALVLDQTSSEVLFEKNANVALPIASITKLMTGLVVVQAQQDMHEVITITDADIDHEKHTSSRLAIGARMTRGDLLHIALMSSENRAASALGRNYPGGISAFVDAMNAKARQLGMNDTHYVDSSRPVQPQRGQRPRPGQAGHDGLPGTAAARIHHRPEIPGRCGRTHHELLQHQLPGGQPRLGHRPAKNRFYQ